MILTGSVSGQHNVTEDLDLSCEIITEWPNWKFHHVKLNQSTIPVLKGDFHSLEAEDSILASIDPRCHVHGDASFGGCTLKHVHGTYDGFSDWSDSDIETLDPQVKFGVNSDGNCADFFNCAKLLEACGTFPGWTDWRNSGVRRINALAEFGKDRSGDSASFDGCHHLLEVAGVFHGWTDWSHSGVKRIDPKTQFGVNLQGASACFLSCMQLTEVCGVFHGSTMWQGSGIKSVHPLARLGMDKRGFCADFTDCGPRTIWLPIPKGRITGALVFSGTRPNQIPMEW